MSNKLAKIAREILFREKQNGGNVEMLDFIESERVKLLSEFEARFGREWLAKNLVDNGISYEAKFDGEPIYPDSGYIQFNYFGGGASSASNLKVLRMSFNSGESYRFFHKSNNISQNVSRGSGSFGKWIKDYLVLFIVNGFGLS